MASSMNEHDDLTSQDLTSTILRWQDFVRPPLPSEPKRKGNRPIKYCAFEGCEYSHEISSTFRSHLRTAHQTQTTTQISAVRKEGTIQLQELWDLAEPRTRESIQTAVFQEYLDTNVVRNALIRFIVQQRLAFSIVESPSFHAFVQALNPAADNRIIPASHSAIRTAIQSHWYSEKLILQREIQTAASQINISLDIWTSPNRILFIAIVAHFVRSSNGTVAKSLIGLRQVAGHSGEEQFHVLRTILLEYEIVQKLGVIIGDNSGTNDTLCRTISKWLSDDLNMEWEPEDSRIRCLGHIINLIVQAFIFAGLSEAIPLTELEAADKEELEGQEPNLVRAAQIRFIGPMGKLHNIVVHIRGSGIRTKEFLDKAFKMIPLDNRTRWNSWYYMIMVALELEMHVDFYVKNQPDLHEDTLTRQDWDMLRTIKMFLKFFKDIMLENEGDAKCLGQSLPSMWLIRSHILAFRTKHERGTSEFDQDCVVRATTAYKAFEKWWNLLWIHPLYQISTVLHPYYRTKFLGKIMPNLRLSQKEQKEKKKWIKQIWLDWVEKHEEKLSKTQSMSQGNREQEVQRKKGRRTTDQIAKEAQDRSIEGMMERVFGDWGDEVGDEWDSYIEEICTKGVNDVLKWWQDPVRRIQYPVLSQFAIEIFSIPPMSDEPERVFSGGRRTISWQRSSLNPDIIEVVECLHHWLNQRNKG
jgi:hypothetical protein